MDFSILDSNLQPFSHKFNALPTELATGFPIDIRNANLFGYKWEYKEDCFENIITTIHV